MADAQGSLANLGFVKTCLFLRNIYAASSLMEYSHWLTPGPGPGPGQGPGRASINQWKHFQDLKNGYQTHSSGPENVPSVLI